MSYNLYQQNTEPPYSYPGSIPPPPPPPPPPPQYSGNIQGGSSSTMAIMSLVMGIISFSFCCGTFVFGILAWIMGKIELNKIDDGESPAAGKTIAKIGMWLGIINVILCFIFYICVIIYYVFVESTLKSNHY